MDDDKVAASLGTVFSGATALMIGFVGGGVLTLAAKIVIARLFSADLYGVFSQGMAVMFMLVMVSMVGLNVGISRFIAYYEGKDVERVRNAVPSALIAVIPLSLLVFAGMYLLADPIATMAFDDPRTATVLRIFAIAGPFMAVNSILIAGFRGHQRSTERVVLLDFVIPLVQIIGVVALVLLGFGIGGATAGFASAFVVTCGIAVLWFRRNHGFRWTENVLPELIMFSWPLMVSSVAVQVFLWTPSILVGMMATSRDVGLLNAALPLGTAAKMVLSSVTFLFLPVTADLFSSDDLAELRNVYAVATRWVLAASLPLIAFFLIHPGRSVAFLFGGGYVEAGIALTALLIGYLVNMGTGPVGDLLIAVGKTRHEMAANVFKLGLFIGLSVLLIPRHGFLGGAAAFSAGMIVGNVIRLAFCWEYVGFFYTWAFLKPVAAVAAATPVALMAPGPIPVQAVGFGLVYVLVLAVLNPLEEVDRQLVERLLGDADLADDPRIRRLLEFLYA